MLQLQVAGGDTETRNRKGLGIKSLTQQTSWSATMCQTLCKCQGHRRRKDPTPAPGGSEGKQASTVTNYNECRREKDC